MPIGRLLPALVLLLVLVAPRPAAAAPRAQDCTFELGFQALHDLIPDVVGDCAAEASTSVGGDAQQQTANGLLVWRKADNWTAFTSGATTWINGPCGLQTRPNDQTFPWEQGGACSPPPPAAPGPAAPAPAAPGPTGFDPQKYLGQGNAFNCSDFTT